MLWATAALVGWARVRTRNHTPRQVIAGFAVAALVMSGAFALVRG
jgi:membrane-associated phospholipid phosphatase